MRLLVGTSGYSYAPWKGRFYPADLPAKRMLAYYAGQFATLEINSTFRRLPTAATIAAWKAEVGRDFRFAIKCSQSITHSRKLRDCAEPLQALATVTASLGAQHGPLLVQLPPFLRADVTLLDEFLAVVPHGLRVTVEFRHASWFDDAAYDVLAKHGAALCLAESDDLVTPSMATAAWGAPAPDALHPRPAGRMGHRHRRPRVGRGHGLFQARGHRDRAALRPAAARGVAARVTLLDRHHHRVVVAEGDAGIDAILLQLP